MRTAAAFLLLLACIVQRASCQWLTDDEISGIKDLCNPGTPALPADACRTCVNDLTITSGIATIQTSGLAWACHGVCQNNDVINHATDAKGAIISTLSTASLRAGLCTSCLSRPGVTAYGCQHCLEANVNTNDVATCMDCLARNPFIGETDPDKSYLSNSYQWACAQCQSIPVNEPSPNAGAARAQCLACIASPTAQRAYPGILSAYEFASTTTDPTPTARDNDFGRCVYYANQTYLINSGSVNIQGVYESCKTGLQTSTKLDCMQCMFAAEKNATSNPDNMNYKLQIATPKDWACSSYCQDPAYQPAGVTLATSQSAKCEACVQSPGVTDAWACGNCLKLSLIPGASVDACFAAVEDDPYAGYASNYNWAVGMCAMITTPSLRDLCLTCIRSQTAPTIQNNVVTLSDAFNKTTEANICSCIDLTLNNTIYTNRVLDPVERQCFERHVYYDENNVEQSPDIPWGVGFPFSTDDACLDCMAQATVIAPRNLNKKYACTEYCQDPKLVKNQNQGQECAICVVNPLVSNPWGCQNCMVVTDDEEKRRRCFQCVQTPTGEFDNHAWGCGMCAQFDNSTARDLCFRCLTVGLDPCSCVDRTRNGTVADALPPQGTCDPATFRVWYWAQGPLSSLEWRIASAPYPLGTVRGSGTVSAPTSTLVPGAGNGNINVYSLDISVASVDITQWPAIEGTKSWFSILNAAPGPAGGSVFWDASQSTGNSADNIFSLFDGLQANLFAIPQLALQILGRCGEISYDSVTNFAFDNGGYSIVYDAQANPVPSRIFTLSAPGSSGYPLGPIATPQQLTYYPTLDGPTTTRTISGPSTLYAPDLGYPTILHSDGIGQVAINIDASLDDRILTATTTGQPSYWDTTLSVFVAGQPIDTSYIAANDDIFSSTSFDPNQCGGEYTGSLFRVNGQWCQLSTVSWSAPAGQAYVLVLSGFGSNPAYSYGPYSVKVTARSLAVGATVGDLHIATANTTTIG